MNGFQSEPEKLNSWDDEQLKLAVVPLLIRASLIDGSVDGVETEQLKRTISRRFNLDESEVLKLIETGKKREAEAVDLYGFTRVITQKLDQKGRAKIVKMLWEIVLADGVVDEFESNLVWRTAELIGVSTRDRVRLRKEVENQK
jgi:uncharacterized tellurite resistance protein B-like protein